MLRCEGMLACDKALEALVLLKSNTQDTIHKLVCC